MTRVTVYTSAFCPYCIWAKQLLEQKFEDNDYDPLQTPQTTQKF